MVDTSPPVSAATSAALAAAAPTPDELALISAAIREIPEKIAQLARQIQLSGLITDIASDFSFTVQTAVGDIRLSLPPLPNGNPNPLAAALQSIEQHQRPLNLLVAAGDPPTQALIAVPHSLLTHNAATKSQTGEDNGKFPSLFTVGQKLSAVVLPSLYTPVAPDATPHGDVAAALKGATSNALFDATLGSLKNLAAPLFSQLQSLSGDNKLGATGKATPAPTPMDPTLFRPGTVVDFRIAAVTLPDAPPPIPDDAEQVPATVVGKGAGGQLVLNANGTTLFVRTSGDLLVGSKLLLERLPNTAADVTLPDNPDHAAQALQQFMAALSQLDPQAAQHLAQTRIPQPNAALPATLLLLFNILQQGGNGGTWLGEAATARLDKAGKRELVVKMIEEMQRGGGEAFDNAVGAWRSYPLPLYDQNMFQMLHLYVHREANRQNQEQAAQAAAARTRFLINLNMTRLGPIQMDGLTQRKQLDMVIRSERPLPPSLPQELRGLYLETLEALGLTGSLNFQNGRQGWVVVQRANKPSGTMI